MRRSKFMVTQLHIVLHNHRRRRKREELIGDTAEPDLSKMPGNDGVIEGGRGRFRREGIQSTLSLLDAGVVYYVARGPGKSKFMEIAVDLHLKLIHCHSVEHSLHCGRRTPTIENRRTG